MLDGNSHTCDEPRPFLMAQLCVTCLGPDASPLLAIIPIRLLQGLLLLALYAVILKLVLNILKYSGDMILFELQKLWHGIGRENRPRVTSSWARWAGPQRPETQGSRVLLCLPIFT